MNGQSVATGVTIVAWAAVVYKLPGTLRRRHDLALRSFWLTLLGIALSLTVLQQPTYGLIDRLFQRPNIARLLGNALTVAASWSIQAFLWRLNAPDDRVRRPIQAGGLVLLAALLIMTVCFLRIPFAREDAELVTSYPAVPAFLGYRLAFLAYLGGALVNVARLTWRYAREARLPLLRLGLRLVAGGALVGLLYVAHEAFWVLAARLGVPLLPASALVSRLLMAGAIGVMLLGSTLPSWGPRVGLDTLWRWLAAYRSLVRLYPLWRDLCLALPDIALVPPSTPLVDRLDLRDVPFRLCRRVVEIRDGLLALRPVIMSTSAADMGGPALAVPEAVAMLAGLWQHETSPAVPAAVSYFPREADLDADVAALEQLACWYQRPASAHLLRHWLAAARSPEVVADRRKVS